ILYVLVINTHLCCAYLCFIFFFQAEDGIRDYKVTGVQTCALPILNPSDFGSPRTNSLPGPGWPSSPTITRAGWRPIWASSPRARSEERRVGKSVDLGGGRMLKKEEKRVCEE